MSLGFVDVGAMLQKNLDNFRISKVSRLRERGPTVITGVLLIRVRSLLKEGFQT